MSALEKICLNHASVILHTVVLFPQVITHSFPIAWERMYMFSRMWNGPPRSLIPHRSSSSLISFWDSTFTQFVEDTDWCTLAGTWHLQSHERAPTFGSVSYTGSLNERAHQSHEVVSSSRVQEGDQSCEVVSCSRVQVGIRHLIVSVA